ncbi:glycogen debranching protein GlgX, partial [Neisseria sp. P0021.S007]
LFDKGGETRLEMPSRRGSVFYGFVPGVGAGQRYGFRVYGRADAPSGSCFNPNKLLIDPYSKKIDGKPSYRDDEEMAWFRPEDERDNAAMAPKSVVVGDDDFDWGNERRPNHPWGRTVVYEAHVKGFTKQFPDLEHAGTYQALTDSRVIDYLKTLGVTAVELLPVHQHLDEYHLQK